MKRLVALIWVWLSACASQLDADVLPPLLVDRTGDAFVFQDPERGCVGCHPTHVAQWRESNHAYAMVDPVFLAMNELGQRQSQGKLGQFCVQCHSPVGLQLQQTDVVQDPASGTWVQDFSKADPVALKGVSCDVCHSITDVMHPSNAQMVYTPDGTYRATISDPVETAAHNSEYSELHESSDLCGSCHNVVNPAGALIEETYDEWADSEFADEGITCQDCHMLEYEGQAAEDGPVRTVHEHYFQGVDVSLVPEDEFPGYWEGRARAEALLASAVEVTTEYDADTMWLGISIANLAGHRLPSGATAERQMWLEIVVTDAEGNVHYETGTLDENGDLRDKWPQHTTQPGSDPDLVKYGQDMLRDPAADGEEGEPYLVTFPWQATVTDNHLIEPGETDTHVFSLEGLPGGRHDVSIRLLFRTFPPYFLRELEEEVGMDPDVRERLPTQVMFKQEFGIDVEGGPTECIDPNDIADCDGECWPADWVGDAICDDGTVFGADFNCATFGFDGGDCGTVNNCPAGEAEDCNGVCWPDSWVGDGLCDNGAVQPWGDPDFDCAVWGWDNGDCVGVSTCPSDETEDCDGACWPAVWLGDGFCDDGTVYAWGDPNFACEVHAWDLGDCQEPEEPSNPGPCGVEGWVEDCDGECWPDSWIGDGFCDDGTLQAWGDPNFDCAVFNQDEGDC